MDEVTQLYCPTWVLTLPMHIWDFMECTFVQIAKFVCPFQLAAPKEGVQAPQGVCVCLGGGPKLFTSQSETSTSKTPISGDKAQTTELSTAP